MTALLLALAVVAVSALTAQPAQASPLFQMPFACGEVWHASTYSGHNAVDWNAYPGDDGRTVVASASGTASIGYGGGLGYYVSIDHGGGWSTLYAHLHDEGRATGTVQRGQAIGYVGSSQAESPHLHWVQKYNGVSQNPLYANGTALNPSDVANPQQGNTISYTSANCAQTLSVAQPLSVGPSNNVAMYAPISWSYRVKNTSGVAASIQRLVVAIRGPSGNALDVICGTGITLQANEEHTCQADVPTGYGQQGTFTAWADWLDYSGNWHQGQLGGNVTLTVGPPMTLVAAQPISIGPSSSIPIYQPMWWSFRVRNTSGAWASIKQFVVPLRGPGGSALQVNCQNGSGVTLAPNQEWTCQANLHALGQRGAFIAWADYQTYDNAWHAGQLGAAIPFNIT